MIMKRAIPTSITILVLGLLACASEPPEQTDEALSPEEKAEALRIARADSVLQAEGEFDPTVFDSIGWRGGAERYERGETVFRYSCVDCHGLQGDGRGPVAERFEIEMPDLTTGDWEYAGDIPAIRHRIYVGHESEMPTWGLYGLPYRDIDAVAFFLNETFGTPEE